MRRALASVLLLFAASVASAQAILAEGVLEIEYAPGEQALAEATLEAAQQGLRDFDDRLPAGDEPIRIIVASHFSVFAEHAGSYATSTVSGVAIESESLIVLKAPGLLQDPGSYWGVLRHELIHILLAQNTNTHFMPRWLNEGIAMRVSGENRWASKLRVGEMYMQGRIYRYYELRRVYAMAGGEMGFGDAYAQSLSMTNFLYDHLGEEEFWAMVYGMRTATFEVALLEAAGWSPAELWEAWRGSLWLIALVFALVSGFGLFQAMALLAVWGYLRKRRRNQRKLAQWAEEEGDDADEPDDEPYEFIESGPYDWETNYRDDDDDWR